MIMRLLISDVIWTVVGFLEESIVLHYRASIFGEIGPTSIMLIKVLFQIQSVLLIIVWIAWKKDFLLVIWSTQS